MKYTFVHKIRHLVKKIPYSTWLYDRAKLLLFPTYYSDGLITIHNVDFISDPDFTKAYNMALRTCAEIPIFIKWRINTLLWAASQAIRLNGDFVECGVDRAFMSTAVMKYTNFKDIKNKKFYLFDTYCGLVDDLVTKNDKCGYKNQYTDCYDFVMQVFKKHSNVVVVKGAVPDSLSNVVIDRVAYLHLDMNCAEPERAALEFFWPRIVKGGIVVFDDYGFSGHTEQKKVADTFSNSHGLKVLYLPTGQGILIKQQGR